LAKLVIGEVVSWRRWLLATLIIGEVGYWRNWLLAKLVVGKIGYWRRWLLAKLVIGDVGRQDSSGKASRSFQSAVLWISSSLFQYRDQWWALVSKVMNNRVP
jgi:hypothetical protein